MATVGRIAATLALALVAGALQSIGCGLIRIPHELFDLAEIIGIIVIGGSWLALSFIERVWFRP